MPSRSVGLVAVGERARPAIPQMKEVIGEQRTGDYALFTRWAIAYALKNLQP